MSALRWIGRVPGPFWRESYHFPIQIVFLVPSPSPESPIKMEVRGPAEL